MPAKETNHQIKVLQETQQAILQKNPVKLKELSNQTIHHSCSHQDVPSITTAIIVYALSKLIERKDYKRVPSWDKFIKKFNSLLDLAIKALKEDNQTAYSNHIIKARESLQSISSLKPYIEKVIRKSCINKASKLYEHGLSLQKTAKLLGITQWELANYTGQSKISDNPLNQSQNIKQRAKMALEFFQ